MDDELADGYLGGVHFGSNDLGLQPRIPSPSGSSALSWHFWSKPTCPLLLSTCLTLPEAPSQLPGVCWLVWLVSGPCHPQIWPALCQEPPGVPLMIKSGEMHGRGPAWGRRRGAMP